VPSCGNRPLPPPKEVEAQMQRERGEDIGTDEIKKVGQIPYSGMKV
jgi:hypothetical protein